MTQLFVIGNPFKPSCVMQILVDIRVYIIPLEILLQVLFWQLLIGMVVIPASASAQEKME